MWRRFSKGLAILALLLLFAPVRYSAGEPDQKEKEALQHFLTIHEIEKELQRIAREEEKIQKDLKEYEIQIHNQQEKMKDIKAQAGQIARAYYMGDRLDLLLFLLQSSSLSQLIQNYDYLTYILAHDQKKLQLFQHEVSTLNLLADRKRERLKELDQLRAHLEAQKELLQVVETSLAEVMAGIPDTAKVELLQEQLIQEWETRGVPAFGLFLDALSQSMAKIPESFKNNITLSLSGPKLKITDKEFTDFLKNQSEIFENFNIQFRPEGIEIFGNYEGMALSIKGTYQLESEEMVSFVIRELTFNGFLLPETSAAELQKKYNPGIYPGQIHRGLKVKEIHLGEGLLEIAFKIEL